MMKRINKIMSAAQALSRVTDGQRVMVGGFGLRGTPNTLIDALVANGARDLTIISNDLGSPGVGLGKFLSNRQVKRLIGTYYSWNVEAVNAYNRGEIEVELVPQGTFAESIRAAGYGIPAYYALASAGTELGKGKETREFAGRAHVLERAIYADVALIQAYKADRIGNLVYCKTARNFNPLMAMAARYTVALVDEIVEVGGIDSECIVTPHVFVQAIVKEESA
jgi:3-oxoacid CoA-transferase A subunit